MWHPCFYYMVRVKASDKRTLIYKPGKNVIIEKKNSKRGI